jgi:hypothetical protein
MRMTIRPGGALLRTHAAPSPPPLPVFGAGRRGTGYTADSERQ